MRFLNLLIIGVSLWVVQGVLGEEYIGRHRGKGVIFGTVVDAKAKVPLEYASIIVYRLKDSVKVTGATTDKEGQFILTGLFPGKYYLTVDFIGYRQEVISLVSLRPPELEVDIGVIELEPVPIQTAPVEVRAETPSIAYKIDKKVIYVSQQSTTTSGTAVDILENVPSVEVDIEGNVKLRGSGSFTLLINGRPTILDPNEALQQIPASTIDRIEIITNPSAKYDPEGVTGILNVILKKGGQRGISGALNIHIGLDNKYGGNILLTRRVTKFNAYLSMSYNRREFPGSFHGRSSGVLSFGAFERDMQGSFTHQMLPTGIRSGLDVGITSHDDLSLGVTYGRWSMERTSEVHYQEIGLSETTADTSLYTTQNLWKRSGPYLSGFLSYEHRFAGQEQKVTVDLSYSRRKGSEESRSLRFDRPTGELLDGTLATEQGPSSRADLRANYKSNLGDVLRMELGYQGNLRNSQTIKRYANYDTLSQEFVWQQDFEYNVQTSERYNSFYSLFKGDHGVFGWQLGIRAEYSDRSIKLLETEDSFTFRWRDFFPSLHLSYDFGEQEQVMVSYSRRVRRPRPWWLEPYLTWIDANTAYQGNPALKPSYSDALELGVQLTLGPIDLNADLYARFTHQRIERTRRTYQGDKILMTYENVGSSEAYGAEINTDWRPLRFLSLTTSLDLSEYRVYSGTYRESFNWNLRLRGILRFGRGSQIQVAGRYASPSVTSQGTREGYYIFDLAFRKHFSRSLNLVLQIRDLLGTGKWSFTSDLGNFSLTQTYRRKTPVVTLNIRYLFNNYRPEKKTQLRIPEEPTDIFEGF